MKITTDSQIFNNAIKRALVDYSEEHPYEVFNRHYFRHRARDNIATWMTAKYGLTVYSKGYLRWTQPRIQDWYIVDQKKYCWFLLRYTG